MKKTKALKKTDKAVYDFITKELNRQRNTLELIASENFASMAVLETAGTILTNKYSEGYIKNRYYGGCQFVDEIENLAIERAKQLFKAEHANVQPHSGTNANFAVYFALLKHGDTILSMDISAGGHLTHGSKVNLSGKSFNIISYGLNNRGYIDFNQVESLALQHKPKLILAGASAYSRKIDFSRFKQIANKIGALFMVDMAHIAGLVAAGLHQNPVLYADVVTSTTHKTLRGPRGGLILCKREYAKRIDKAVFPGMQGGPLQHIIAAKAVAFKEAMLPEFKTYQQQVVANSKAFAQHLKALGFKIVSGGTDNHLFLVDLTNKKISGKDFETMLEEIGITVNKNSIPNDALPPQQTSGIRLGTPSITTRGMREEHIQEIAEIMASVLKADKEEKQALKKQVEKLCKNFPLYKKL